MTKNEILKQIEELKQHVLKMEEEFPKDGEEYFFIANDVEIGLTTWDGYIEEEFNLSIGNCFKTKEEAKFYIEKLKVIHELKKFSKPFDHERDNWIFLWDVSDKKIMFNSYCFFQLQGLFFESEERAREAIEAVGEERVKKYYLEVKE